MLLFCFYTSELGFGVESTYALILVLSYKNKIPSIALEIYIKLGGLGLLIPDQIEEEYCETHSSQQTCLSMLLLGYGK